MGQIKWYKRDPDAALSGMMGLNLEERGAYNTVLDLIYTRDGNLPDDDRFIAGWLSADLRVWKRIKSRLITLGKLYVEDGLIRNRRADVEVLSALSRVGSARDAGLASAQAKAAKSGRAARKNSDLASTGVQTDVSTPVSTNHNHNQKDIEPNGSTSSLRASAPTKSKTAAQPKLAMTVDWKPAPLPPTVQALVDEWPPGRFEREIDQFRDYWIDRGEKRAGWDRTFHNRIRDIHDRVIRDNRNGTYHGNQNSGFAPAGYRGQRNRDGLTAAIDDMLEQAELRHAARPS